MTTLNRRNWLKMAGALGASSMAGPLLAQNNVYKSRYALKSSSDQVIKLSSNENPFAPSSSVREAMIKAFDEACRYPHQRRYELAKVLAKHEGVSPGHIVITGGSTEGLKATGLTLGMNGGEIIAADPTFKALLTYAAQFGAFINKVPLDANLEHDLDEMEKRVHNGTKMIFLCNPNNPTGTIIPKDQLRDFCTSVSKKTVVFSDEAYYDYIEDAEYPSMVELIKEGHNIIVSRTFSKVYGLAGLRIGYLIARPDLAYRIGRNAMALTNMLAIHAAQVALEETDFYNYSLAKNKKAKNYIYELCDELNLRYYKSHTNFVFFHSGREIQDLISGMLKEGVRIGRPFPPLRDWCRISTGTMDEMYAFGTALRKVMT